MDYEFDPRYVRKIDPKTNPNRYYTYLDIAYTFTFNNGSTYTQNLTVDNEEFSLLKILNANKNMKFCTLGDSTFTINKDELLYVDYKIVGGYTKILPEGEYVKHTNTG